MELSGFELVELIFFFPRRDRAPAVRHILEILEPLSIEKGGPLRIQHVSFVEVPYSTRALCRRIVV